MVKFHVLQTGLRKNKQYGNTELPVILVKFNDKVERCHEVEILGPSKLVYVQGSGSVYLTTESDFIMIWTDSDGKETKREIIHQ